MSKRLPLRDAIARIERRDPVLPAVFAPEPAVVAAQTEPPAIDRRTVSVEVRLDRALFMRYRSLQHELRQRGEGEPTLREIVAAILSRLPEEPEAVHRLVATWRTTDPESRRPYGERDLHRLRVDLPTGLVRRVEALLFSLELDGRPLALSEVVRACLAQGPRSTDELGAIIAPEAPIAPGAIDHPTAEEAPAGFPTPVDLDERRHDEPEKGESSVQPDPSRSGADAAREASRIPYSIDTANDKTPVRDGAQHGKGPSGTGDGAGGSATPPARPR